MRRILSAFCLMTLCLALAGCFGSDSSDTSDPTKSGRDYYYAEFADVAIPTDMTVDAKDTFITYSADGVKLGIELASGRVEMASLINVMERYMQRDGWNLRSIFRAKRSIMVFERSDRMCTLYISEGMIYTDMLVFVSHRLPDGAVQHAPAAAAPAAPVAPSATVQSYPAGGFSNASSTSLPR